jgi:cytochrome P450 family 110
VHAGSSGSHRHTWRDWLRSARAGVDPDGFMRQCAGDPGPFTLIFPGLGPVHFVASVDAAREILTTPREALCAPTPNPIEPIVGPESVILTSGAVHRRQRTLLSPAFHGAQMRDRAEGMASAVIDEISLWRAGDQIALHTTARSITLRIIIQVVLGVAAGPACQAYADVVSALMNANTAPLMLLPILRKNFAGMGPWARLVRLRSQFDNMLSDQIRIGPRHCPVTGRAPILTELLEESDVDEVQLSEDELQQQLRTLIIAGHDTTAAALAWGLYHIHREPGVWQRLTAELCADPSAEQLAKLPYLSAVIAETLRMHPAVPIVLRKLVAPRTISGVQRAAGDIVGIAVPAVHFNPELFPDPYHFRPERFLARNPTPFEYMPFGGGYRRCLGATFAMYELAVAIGTTMRKVVLTMPDRELRRNPPRSIPRGIATVPRRDVKLLVIDRI